MILADVAWGLGFVFLVWLAFYLSGGNERALLVNALVTVWGVRLAWHIHIRAIMASRKIFVMLSGVKTGSTFTCGVFYKSFMLQGGVTLCDRFACNLYQFIGA
jgi:steroid 5-alpha reductase family enzyme